MLDTIFTLISSSSPSNFDGFKPWQWQFYKHVGMRVQLHGVGRLAKWRLRNALDVTYPLYHDWISEMKRIFLSNNIFINMNTPAGFKRNHTLTEHQRRLHFASQYRLALGNSGELTAFHFDRYDITHYSSYSLPHCMCNIHLQSCITTKSAID